MEGSHGTHHIETKGERRGYKNNPPWVEVKHFFVKKTKVVKEASRGKKDWADQYI